MEHPQTRFEREMLEMIGNSNHLAAAKARNAAADYAFARWVWCGPTPVWAPVRPRLLEKWGILLAERLGGR